MTHDKPDYDHEIAKVLQARERLQARYDAVKYTSDSCNIIDRRAELAAADRQLIELRQKQAAAQRVEPVRNSSVFYGSNN